MKLYNGLSPNGLRVMVFLAEKGVEMPTQMIDILSGETRQDTFLAINPLGQVPVLELDDGTRLTESIAICRYLEHLHPEPHLFGTTPRAQAIVEMWMRRMELRLFNTASDIGLHEFELFKDVVEQNADYAQSQRRLFAERLGWFNSALSDGRPFVVGETFSMADIIGMGMLFLMGFCGLEIPADLTHARRWAAAMKTRPSFPTMPQAA